MSSVVLEGFGHFPHGSDVQDFFIFIMACFYIVSFYASVSFLSDLDYANSQIYQYKNIKKVKQKKMKRKHKNKNFLQSDSVGPFNIIFSW